MKIHRRNTNQSGADRMILDHSWHSSTPLDKIQVGDILRVKNKETLVVIDWKVNEFPIKLNSNEAKSEWLKYPFGNPKSAERQSYFPFVLRNLGMIKEYPPKTPSPRHISREVRIKVYSRDNGKCKRCGAKENLEFDHIIPVAKGGSNTEKNIELLCKRCFVNDVIEGNQIEFNKRLG